MKIRTLVFAVFAFFSASASAVHCSFFIALSAGGGGTVSYDAVSSCSDHLNTVSNLAISITVGATTWDQTQLTAKFPPPPYGTLAFPSSSCSSTFWDDDDDGSGDTAVAIFTNGPQVLTFDEGDFGSRVYSINGTPTGTYTANLPCAHSTVPVPGLSPLSLALLGLMLAALGFAAMRWRRPDRRNTSA
jgi:hypothetical protein